jgi:hypothetical protein
MKKIVALMLFLAVLAPAVNAQTNAPAGRSLSLQDCIAEALRHNIDVQIQRYEPEISLYNLYQAYAGYDATFTASGVHSYNFSPSVFNPYVTNFAPATISDRKLI